MDVDCSITDQKWGPWAGACRGGLDFTINFEASILTILPCAVLFAVTPWRVISLKRRSKKVEKSPLLTIKQVSFQWPFS
jgi:ATP-binding cassette, subfamily C (CFTR/MRP), member 1